MLRLNSLLVITIVSSLVGCSEESLVTPSDSDAMLQEGTFAKNGAVITKDWILDEGEDVVDGPYFIPCINDGDGEDVMFTLTYQFITQEVVTPSGNVHWNGWLEEFESEFTGLTSGDHWVGSGIAHVAYHFFKDGSARASEALHETYENDVRGQRLKLLYHFKVTPDVPYSFEVISCQITC